MKIIKLQKLCIKYKLFKRFKKALVKRNFFKNEVKNEFETNSCENI